MIAKISATENLGGALGYNFKKVEKGDAEVILSKGHLSTAEGEFKMEEVLRDMQVTPSAALPNEEKRFPLLPQSSPR